MQKFNIALLSLLFSGTVALTAAETNKWDASLAAGATLTKGNSDTFLGNLTFKATRKYSPYDEVLLGAGATYGTTKKEEIDIFRDGSGNVVGTRRHDVTDTTTANASASGQYNHLFTERFYGGVRLDLLHDAVADVKYRVTLSPLAGYYLIKQTNTFLAVEAGPSLVTEKVGNESDTYAALRLAERFEHKFSNKAKVWQSIEILPQIDRFENYIVNAEVGAEASLTENFSLRGVIQDTYDNEPADGRKKNDIKLITSLVYKF
jgi:putative salt-induced outer membrane protein YdiY